MSEFNRMSLATLSADELGSLDRAIEHGRALLDDQVQGLKSFLGRTGVSSEMMFEQIVMRHAQIVATTKALGVLEELRAGGGGQR